MSARIPLATYRMQFNAGFTLERGTALIDYLHELGISDCYASPLAQARPGSIHGYDVTDPRVINPEVGGEEQLVVFTRQLKARGMGLILDTVPNHMCIAHPSNLWWWDVLENGPSSPFAHFFDIDWNPPKADLINKVLLPMLGDQYGRTLENGEIKVVYQGGRFRVRYYDWVLPVAPRTWTWILRPALEKVRAALGESDQRVMELESIITAISHLPPRTETNPALVRERQREKEVIKSRLSALVENSPEFRSAIDASLAELNGIRGDPHSFDRLERLLADQAYRLSFWHVAADEINYRRFFDINELAAIRVEDPVVFEAVHELTLRLISQGLVTGLRIDHADGLFDPGRYLRTLQERCAAAQAGLEGERFGRPPSVTAENSRPFYIVAEKILTGRERLHQDWPVHGTTGYEFANLLNAIFVDDANHHRFEDLYARFAGWQEDFREIVYECKKLVLRASMSGEQNVLARKLDQISEQHRWSRDFTLNSLGRVLAEVIACFPVYRSYVTSAGSLTEDDRRQIRRAIDIAKRRNAALSASTFDFLQSVLLLEHPEGLEEAARDERLAFTLHFQQLTSPVMAKGFEDTALYRYCPLVSLNEVGGDPTCFGLPNDEFHARNARRVEQWPHGLCATSTHDTKRSEDVRARINVLSEIPDQWERAIWRWHHLTEPARVEIEGTPVPDANEEYIFYQTLIGTWPLSPLPPGEHENYIRRIENYMDKAAKEAKVRTSWIRANDQHDRGLAQFVRAVTRLEADNAFLADFAPFARRVAQAGMLNSLSQTVLKIASPGVPDFYQGTELWDFSLVDPDNRGPVDYSIRMAMLAEIKRAGAADRLALVRKLFADPADGAIKMYVTATALGLRGRNEVVFRQGAYTALETSGNCMRKVIAFARGSAQDHVIVAAGRFFAEFAPLPDACTGDRTWQDTFLSVPSGLLHECYVELFTGQEIRADRDRDRRQLCMGDIFAHLPVAMLVPVV
ncbi:MAG: malto-oligosyltrehalose synthase [Candidatus Binataceae bacterium]